ncbi:hypothetical protein HMI54_010139, partial [Coelomomyces lativittatus]
KPQFHVSFATCPSSFPLISSATLTTLFHPYRSSFLQTLMEVKEVQVRIGHLDFQVALKV